MPTRNSEPSPNSLATESLGTRGGNIPETGKSSIVYIGRKEPRVPVTILIIGFVAVAAAIAAFVHFSRP
jgi:hypothetical protein